MEPWVTRVRVWVSFPVTGPENCSNADPPSSPCLHLCSKCRVEMGRVKTLPKVVPIPTEEVDDFSRLF